MTRCSFNNFTRLDKNRYYDFDYFEGLNDFCNPKGLDFDFNNLYNPGELDFGLGP